MKYRNSDKTVNDLIGRYFRVPHLSEGLLREVMLINVYQLRLLLSEETSWMAVVLRSVAEAPGANKTMCSKRKKDTGDGAGSTANGLWIRLATVSGTSDRRPRQELEAREEP